MTESFAQLFEESLATFQARPGSIVIGTIMDIRPDVVVVNAGLKSEGVIPIDQFRMADGALEINLGDQVEVAVDALEDGTGETQLSREKARRARAWEDLEKTFEAGEIVSGMITGKVKGGFTVQLGDIRAFLPGSLVDMRPVRDPTYLEGKDIEFKIIKLDAKRNNVVLSRRAVVESEFSAERETLLKNLEEGVLLKGVVKNLTDYGAFVDLGGIDGLLHITDMAWKRVKHPSEMVDVGDEIDVKVLKFDRERNRVSLGMKQLGADPWEDLERRYPVNTRLFGHITNITDYGCFVEIEPGIEGLVHVSEMDWTNKNINPAKVVQTGDEVEVMVIDVDSERRRVSLGMKQCKANPWDNFAASNKKGDHVTGQIKSITDFGIFIGLEGGIDGLVHLSDISWNVPGEEAVRNYKKGQELETVVLSVDPERERISLGIKQIEKDPYSAFIAKHPKGSLLKGVVREVELKAAIIDLGGGVEGHLRAAEVAQERIDDIRSVMKVGDEVEAKFIAVDKKNRTIALSIKAKDVDEEQAAVRGYAPSSAVGTASLGDIIKEQMDSSEES